MTTRPPVTFTNHAGIAHMRRTGQRTTICGRYFPATQLTSETLHNTAPICDACTTIIVQPKTPPRSPQEPLS